MAKRINNGRWTAWVGKSEALITEDGKDLYAIRWQRGTTARGEWGIFRVSDDPYRPLGERVGICPTLKAAVNWSIGL